MKALGDDYEVVAARWLQDRGMRVLARNFRARTGEIDIIARDGQSLVFIEVRARSNPHFAGAAASVDRRKQARILRTAELFMQHHPQWADLACRFDVVAFEPPHSAGSPQLRWIRAAFTA